MSSPIGYYMPLGERTERRCFLPPDITWDDVDLNDAESSVDNVGVSVTSQPCQPPAQPQIQDHRRHSSSSETGSGSCCPISSCCRRGGKEVIVDAPTNQSRSGAGSGEVSVWDTDAKPGKYGRLAAHIDMNEAKVIAVPPQKAKKGCCNIM